MNSIYVTDVVNVTRTTSYTSLNKEMNSKNGIVSVYAFLLGLSIVPVVLLLQNGLLSAYTHGDNVNTLQLFAVYVVVANILVRIINRGAVYKVSVSQSAVTLFSTAFMFGASNINQRILSVL